MEYILVIAPAMGCEANRPDVPRTIELKDNTVVVVLGASGDLAKKKTVSRADAGSWLLANDFPSFPPCMVW